MKKLLLIVLIFMCDISFCLTGKNLIFYNYIRYNNQSISEKEVMFILKEVYRNANKYDVSKELILAVMKTESNFNRNAMSHANACGYMQIVPQLEQHLKLDRKNHKQNIECGIKYLAMAKKEFGYTNNMIASYNRGINGVKQKGYNDVKETREYVAKVNNELRKILNEVKILRANERRYLSRKASTR